MSCQQCKDWAFKQDTGRWPSGQAFHRWAMFGCTCASERADEVAALLLAVAD